MRVNVHPFAQKMSSVSSTLLDALAPLMVYETSPQMAHRYSYNQAPGCFNLAFLHRLLANTVDFKCWSWPVGDWPGKKFRWLDSNLRLFMPLSS